MLMRIVTIGFVLLGCSGVSGASDAAAQGRSIDINGRAAKPPWEWTLDERLADRFDRAKIRERQAAYEAAHPQAAMSDSVHAQSNTTSTRHLSVHGIDGSRNPELFLPYELFDGLLTGLDPDESVRVKQRAYYQVRKLGYDEETFWSTLASASAAYLPLRFATNYYSTSMAETARRNEEICRERYAALQTARSVFGARQFDVVLYTIVAPYSSFSEATFEADPGAKYRRAEKGCR